MSKTIMTSKQLIDKAALATMQNTMYVLGGWGQLATSKNKAKAISQYAYNKKRKDAIESAPYRTWFFDCVCFVKSLCWGWSANYCSTNGGAVYASNGVPDTTEKGLLNMCGANVWDINDKSHLVPGCLMYMNGHVGLYAGEGKVIECSPACGGVRVTQVTYQQWKCYGMFEFIDYGNDTPQPTPAPVENFVKGAKIILNNAPLYASCTSKTVANHLTGYFYLSDGKDFKSRYRVCRDRMYCGAINKVLGYVRKDDIKCVPR